MRDHREPKPWLLDSWSACPDRVNSGPEFTALPKPVQVEVCRHWFWCMNNDVMRGAGLGTHYNYLKWEEAEQAFEADIIPGVTLDGCIVKRSEY